MRLATDRGQQRLAVAPQSFCGKVGVSVFCFHPGAMLRSFVFKEHRFITVRVNERLTPASQGKQRLTEDEVKTFYPFSKLSIQWPAG